MNLKTSLNLNNFNLINFISWCVFALPIILIFSNSLADIIVVKQLDTRETFDVFMANNCKFFCL